MKILRCLLPHLFWTGVLFLVGVVEQHHHHHQHVQAFVATKPSSLTMQRQWDNMPILDGNRKTNILQPYASQNGLVRLWEQPKDKIEENDNHQSFNNTATHQNETANLLVDKDNSLSSSQNQQDDDNNDKIKGVTLEEMDWETARMEQQSSRKVWFRLMAPYEIGRFVNVALWTLVIVGYGLNVMGYAFVWNADGQLTIDTLAQRQFQDELTRGIREAARTAPR